ncbi:MAG: DUF2147 domain-containing protein [Sphingorhabdus sp.]|nr:DUF2147 domain-containing protein [Sphingorhabdus sp.]
MKFDILKQATLFAVISAAMSSAALAAPAPINGQWITQDKDAVVTIGQCGATICGKLAKYLVPPPNGNDQKDINNPDKSLRDRKLLGAAFLTGFVPKGNEWRGKVYDPKNGKTYKSIMYLGKSGNLVMKGCIGPFCRSQTWTPR